MWTKNETPQTCLPCRQAGLPRRSCLPADRQTSAKMDKKIIGFDLDGVIIDHSAVKISLAKEFGFDLKPKQTSSDVIKKYLPFLILRKIQLCIYHDPKISLSAPLFPDVKLGLKQIKNQNLPYFLISRRKDRELTIKLLKLRNLWPEYFNEKNSFLVQDKESKNFKTKALAMTHYIDDEPSVLEKLVDVQNKFLFDPFETFKHINSYCHVKSWPEFVNYLL